VLEGGGKTGGRKRLKRSRQIPKFPPEVTTRYRQHSHGTWTNAERERIRVHQKQWTDPKIPGPPNPRNEVDSQLQHICFLRGPQRLAAMQVKDTTKPYPSLKFYQGQTKPELGRDNSQICVPTEGVTAQCSQRRKHSRWSLSCCKGRHFQHLPNVSK